MAPYYQMRQPERVSTFKIYLSNLPDALQNAELKALFEEYGRTVECEVFKKNYAFVHMEEEVCGRKAVSCLNRKDVNGKVISVSVSKNLEPPNIAMTKLGVKNLPLNMNAVGLRKLFQKFGLVLEAEITRNGDGIVSMEATGDIRTAINEISAMEMEGKRLLVEPVKVNLKAERHGHPPPQMDWNPKPLTAGYAPPQHYRPEPMPRAPPTSHYALGGGYSAQAQAEEFYGNQQEEYYEEEEEVYYEEEEYYPPAVYPPPQFEPPIARRYAMVPPPRPQYQMPMSRGRGGGHPGLRPGVDYMRRGDVEYYEDEPLEPPPPYMMRQQEPVHLVPRNPPMRGFAPPRGGFGAPRGMSRGRGRGGPARAPAPILIPKRKVVRGEPYPAPPVPPARLLLGHGARGGGMRPPFLARGAPGGRGGPIRPKSRGERGGKNALTAGKLAKLRELESAGVEVPEDLEGRVEFINRLGFTPPGPKKKTPIPPNTNLPDSSGGAQGPSLLATARAAAAAHAAATATYGSGGDSDPFGPSAVEKKYFQQQDQKISLTDPNIDFTADIMLT